jgi:hypothetical protein
MDCDPLVNKFICFFIIDINNCLFPFSVPNVLGVVDYGMEQSGIADVALILDTSTYSLDDDVYQNQVR